MYVHLSSLYILICRYTSRLEIIKTQKHKQKDVKTSLRISDAGREAALYNVTLDISGHKEQRRRSPCPGPDVGLQAKPEQASLYLLYPK